MTGTNVPPQAYTTETLARAYEWLKKQPASIQELAQNADSLVGMYLRSQRMGDRRPSNDVFKSDLKNLANNMRQFELPNAPGEPPPAKEKPVVNKEALSRATPTSRAPVNRPSSSGFDPKTEALLSRVQKAFNLSQKDEALRMLVTLGYEQIKAVLPSTED